MLEIRQYQASDYETVQELHVLGIKQLGAYIGHGTWDDDLLDIENHYLNSGGEFLIGVYENRVVCMGAFRKKSETLAEIKRMRVYPEYQRRGFGQIILSRLEEKASRMGYTELCLDTTVKQVAAQQLYEKNGYIETNRGKFAGLDIIYYRKKIGETKADE